MNEFDELFEARKLGLDHYLRSKEAKAAEFVNFARPIEVPFAWTHGAFSTVNRRITPAGAKPRISPYGPNGKPAIVTSGEPVAANYGGENEIQAGLITRSAQAQLLPPPPKERHG